MRKKKLTYLMFTASILLLLGSAVGSTRAALTYYSDNYVAEITVSQIGVSLLENGETVSSRDYSGKEWKVTNNRGGSSVNGALLTRMLGEGEQLALNKKYDEKLTVKNSGTIDEYVRVRVYRYWMKDGKKITSLSPDLIDLNLVNLGTDWLIDQEASTRERTVLYYNKLLASQSETPLFADKLTIDGSIADRVGETRETSGGYTTITVTYEYDGARFCIEAKVDGVQEHNAQDAIWSAWGRRVTIDNGVLSLN